MTILEFVSLTKLMHCKPPTKGGYDIISVMKGVGSVNIDKRLTTHDRVLLQRYPSTTIDTERDRSDVGCENLLVMKIDTTCTTNY